MIKNNEIVTKGYTLLNFVDNNKFDLVCQSNLSISNLKKFISKIDPIISDDTTLSHVNLRFAIFIILKRILLIKENLQNFKINYCFSDLELMIEKHNLENIQDLKSNLNSENEISLENSLNTDLPEKVINSDTKNDDLNKSFLKYKIEDLIKSEEIPKKIAIMSLEMFKMKIDSDSNEVSNFFSYLFKEYKNDVIDTFSSRNYNLEDFERTNEITSILKSPNLFESLDVKGLAALNEGFINTEYVSAGIKKDLYFYVPKLSLFYFSATITYYDVLLNIYRYDPLKEGTDKFVQLGKEQKIESDFTPFELTIFSYKPEIYKLTIDNYYSWLNGKEIRYKYSILEISEKINRIELHKFSVNYKIDFFKEQILNKITEFVFNKFETFLGNSLEKYSKKVLNIAHLPSYDNVWLQKYLTNKKEQVSDIYGIFKPKFVIKSESVKDKVSSEDSNKKELEDELILADNITELEELKEPYKQKYISLIKKSLNKISNNINSLSYSRRSIKLDRLASIHIIIKSFIKNVFVRVNMSEEELEDETFKTELCKFSDCSDQFIFFCYFYLKQNKNHTLGDYFEEETYNNSNIIFMKFSLVESALIYYVHNLILEDSKKIPSNIIYFHFDKKITNFNWAIYRNNEVVGNESSFNEDDNIEFDEVIKSIINSIDFKKENVELQKIKKKKKQDSEDESSDSDEESEEDELVVKKSKLKKWKIVCSFTGGAEFTEESKILIKNKISDLNSHYVKEGKTKNEKNIKVIFKGIDFVCDMTDFMHCFEIY